MLKVEIFEQELISFEIFICALIRLVYGCGKHCFDPVFSLV